MAQIIKHRRGSLESISGATKRAGELLVVTGSAGISAVNGSSLLFVGIDGSTATPANKVLQGTSVPNLSGAGYDTSIDGIPFYDTAAQKLYILNKGGNVEIKATANTGGTGIVSSSAQVTELLPVGTVSGSSQVVGILSSLNTFSASEESKNSTLATYTASVDSRISGLNTFTASQESKDATLATYTASVDSRLNQLSTDSGSQATRLTALESFSSSLDSGFVTQTELASATGALETVNTAQSARLTSIESFTSSIDTTIKTKLNVEGVFSSSAQVNADSITNFDTNVKDKLNVDGVISGSSQVNADSITNFDTNVKDKLNVDGVISGSSQVQIGSVTGFSTFSQSVDSRLDTIEDSLGGAGSIGSRVSSLEAFSSSQESKDATLETYTASVDGRLDNLESFSSSQEDLNATFATTGSNIFFGTQTITGSLYITQNLIVQGSSSLQNITASAVDIGTNIVNLNTSTPAVRFGGVSVADSGSNQGVSGSLLWDSLHNHWLYVQPSGSGEEYNSAILIAGPKNAGALGEESGITSGSIQVGLGENHIGDSIMTQNVGATKITIAGALDVTGNISGSIVGIGNVTAFSSSVDSRLDTIEASLGGGGSIGTRVSSLEGFSGSQETKNATLATYTASVDSHISAINSFSASQISKDSTLATYTASVDIHISAINSFSASEEAKNATLATYTASVDSRLDQLSTDSGSQASRLTALESFSSSLDAGFVTQAELASATGALETVNTAQSARLTSLEGFSGSQETKNSTLATYTASVDSRLNQLSTDSGSQAGRLSSIEGFTSSIDTTIKTKLNVETVVSSSAQIVTLLSNQATDFGTGRVSADSIGNVDGTSTITGSFIGDGSQLTGLVTTLKVTGSNGSTGTVDLLTQGITFTSASGQGLGIAVSGQTVTFSNVNASTSTKGVASFDADDFSVSTGNVSIKANGVRATNLNSDVAGTGLSLDGVDNSIEVDYGSTAGTAVEGNTSLTIQGTTHEIEISGGAVTLGTGGTVTIGLPNSVTIATASIQNNLSVGGNVSITGNLYVQGSTTTIDSTTIQLGDNIIELNGSAAANGGLLVKDATNPNTVSGSLLWNSTADHWMGGALGSEKQFARFNSTPTSGSVQVIGANGLLVNSTISDNGVDVTITNDLIISGLTANSFVVADGSKTLTSVAAVNAGDLIQWNGSSFVASNTIDGGTF